ncbi:MAG: isoleucine--tRNA ligase [Candidatus Aenigmatarchaeota archaeon]
MSNFEEERESSLYNPQEIEKRILEFWEKEKIFEKLRERNRGNKRFSFLDGPITANNPMGVHHAWGRTLKDLFQRFYAMLGYDERYQNGFDCHGLWVEVEVEKELGFKSKKDIERFGIENFIEKCKERVLKFSEIQTRQSIRLGQWMDWKNSYYTMSEENIEAIWYFLKLCHKNGWIYESVRVMPWCPRCGTSLSQHELLDSYKEMVHPGVYLKFKIKGKDNEYLLVWTTTPWTLTSNIALAVNPNFFYLKIKHNNEIYYIAEKLVNKLFKENEYEILKRLNGKELIGLEYESIYPYFTEQKDVIHKVIAWDMVSEDEGTGIVHIAPGCGEEDYELGMKYNLKAISPLDEFGVFKEGFDWLTGIFYKDGNKMIIEDLKNRGILIKVEDYSHRYPVCWRCKEELVFRLVKEWFIKMNEIRPKLIEEVEKVNWHPEFGKKLMIDWLNNMKDWCISRKRYWGLPLPFYKCSCGNLEVIGSRKELEEKASSGLEKLKELHRPWIDEVKIKCSKCGNEIERIKEVGDCWLDAGIVAFSTLNYFSDRSYWEKWYPADMVCEMREQIKLWFFFLLLMSVVISGKAPYKNVVIYEKILDEKGNPMHKSLGNVIWLDDAFEKIGADVMRWLYVTHDPKENLNFGFNIAREIRRKLNIFYNVNKYVKTYIEVNNFDPKKERIYEMDKLHKWLFSKLERTKLNVENLLKDYDFYRAAKNIEDFILNEFSRWYIHIIREKVRESYTGEDKDLILYSLYTTQLELTKMLAPFIPFFAEDTYQNFFKRFEKFESVHLMPWPEVNKTMIDDEIEKEMEIIKEIIEVVNALKKEKNIKNRWVLDKITIYTSDSLALKACETFKEEIKILGNSMNVEVLEEGKNGKEFSKGYVELGNVLKEESLIREITRYVQEMRKRKGLKVGEKIILYLSDASLASYKEEIAKRVNAIDIIFGKIEEDFGKIKFEDKEIAFRFEKC